MYFSKVRLHIIKLHDTAKEYWSVDNPRYAKWVLQIPVITFLYKFCLYVLKQTQYLVNVNMV